MKLREIKGGIETRSGEKIEARMSIEGWRLMLQQEKRSEWTEERAAR